MKRKLNPNLPEIEPFVVRCDLPELEWLEHNLEALSFCCTRSIPVNDVPRRRSGEEVRGISGSYELGYWPSRELLQEIDDDVAVLALHCSPKVRGFSLAWKEFAYVNKCLRRLQLKSRVNNLISHALDMLPSESELNKVVRDAKEGTGLAQSLLRHMVADTQKFAELFEAALQMDRKRILAEPVAKWIVRIGHPMRKHFVSIAGFDPPFEVWQRRLGYSKRQRRRRLKKNSSKSVTAIQPPTREKAPVA